MRRIATLAISIALLGTACGPTTALYIGHITDVRDGREWHSCAGGGECEMGWACVKDGCEWCGNDRDTRCTSSLD